MYEAVIREGRVAELAGLLRRDPSLGRMVIVDQKGVGRTLLHVATDWPGHWPRVAETITLLIAAGADPDAPVEGVRTHQERPLHWAASSNDVAAIDALLDGGADIEAPGAVFTGGTPMSDAVVFAQWDAARRLLERGAKTTFTQAAALGLRERVEAYFAGPGPSVEEVTKALWHASRAGHLEMVQLLAERGGDIRWLGWDGLTPLAAAERAGQRAVADWLISAGGR